MRLPPRQTRRKPRPSFGLASRDVVAQDIRIARRAVKAALAACELQNALLPRVHAGLTTVMLRFHGGLDVLQRVCKRMRCDRDQRIALSLLSFRLKGVIFSLKLSNALVKRACILRELESILRRLQGSDMSIAELDRYVVNRLFRYALVMGGNSSLDKFKAEICAVQCSNQSRDHEGSSKSEVNVVGVRDAASTGESRNSRPIKKEPV